MLSPQPPTAHFCQQPGSLSNTLPQRTCFKVAKSALSSTVHSWLLHVQGTAYIAAAKTLDFDKILPADRSCECV